jgi:hypothetical protein
MNVTLDALPRDPVVSKALAVESGEAMAVWRRP